MIQGNWERTSVSRRRFLGWAGLGAGGLAVAASGASPRTRCVAARGRPSGATLGGDGTLDRSEWRTDLREVAHVRSPGAPITTRASFVVQDGVPGTQRA